MIDNDINLVEQPEVNHDQGEGISQLDKMGQDGNEGSTYGKFKSKEALLEAYNNLQSEFTKKCQALAKMQNIDNVSTPSVLQEGFDEKINQFVDQYPEAKDYVEDIKELIKNDKNVANSENPIFVAWTNIATTNFKSPKNLILDNEFLENYIFSNKSIKEQIVKNFINELSRTTSPKVMGEDIGAKSPLTPSSKPKTLQEAGRIAVEMLK